MQVGEVALVPEQPSRSARCASGSGSACRSARRYCCTASRCAPSAAARAAASGAYARTPAESPAASAWWASRAGSTSAPGRRPRPQRGEQPPVQRQPAGRRHLLGHGEPGQLVPERHVAVVHPQHPALQRLVQRAEAVAEHVLEQAQLGPGAGQRDRVERVPGRRRTAAPTRASTASRTVAGTSPPPAASTSVTKNGFPPVTSCSRAGVRRRPRSRPASGRRPATAAASAIRRMPAAVAASPSTSRSGWPAVASSGR